MYRIIHFINILKIIKERKREREKKPIVQKQKTNVFS